MWAPCGRGLMGGKRPKGTGRPSGSIPLLGTHPNSQSTAQVGFGSLAGPRAHHYHSKPGAETPAGSLESPSWVGIMLKYSQMMGLDRNAPTCLSVIIELGILRGPPCNHRSPRRTFMLRLNSIPSLWSAAVFDVIRTLSCFLLVPMEAHLKRHTPGWTENLE
ncbi:hypothetical protein GOODEAATRI_002005 [Goodea atripinnis]|uniref:Uncharacterized protein n=1 Tax=Goodea atripinnis TaxID=208336 RepID=A0ABV0PUK7_9TELE